MAKVDPGATTIHVTALDDYQIDLPLAAVDAGGIFLATKRGDGEAIPIEEGGPTRIVYLGGAAAGASARPMDLEPGDDRREMTEPAERRWWEPARAAADRIGAVGVVTVATVGLVAVNAVELGEVTSR